MQLYRPFSQQILLRLVIKGKAQLLLVTLMMALFDSSAPGSHDSVTVSQHAKYHTKWNSAIIHFIICTYAFTTVTCQNVVSFVRPLIRCNA